MTGRQDRPVAIGATALPVLFMVWLWWGGLRCWFSADDFAWLGLLRQLHSAADLPRILFEPAAQGTIRPWSERGFFLLFEALFGLDNLPFRIAAFVTMAANLLLVGWIMRRLTGSGLAGMVAGSVAGIVWIGNAALMVTMTWSAAYNEAMCPLFLLSALALFIRCADSGRWRYWWWQLVVFVLGFGALEIEVVYPALAAAWVLFVLPREKRSLLRTLVVPAAISVVYFLVHVRLAPLPKTGDYTVHVDSRMFAGLRDYIATTFLPTDWGAFGHSHRAGLFILTTGLAAVVALLIVETARRRYTVWFFVAWYLATLAPVLPLPVHRSDYYLTIPLIGLGMLAGWAVARPGLARGSVWQIAPVAVVVVYLAGMIPVARSSTEWARQRAVTVRALVLGVEAAHQAHPGKTIVLDGITTGLYMDVIGQGAFYPLGIDDVYLTPETTLSLAPGANIGDPARSILDPAVTRHAVDNDEVVIYSVAGDHLRNITEVWERSAPTRLPDRLPTRVDVGNPLFFWLLGPGWRPAAAGVRWMPGRATLRIAGPDRPRSRLSIEGYIPEALLKTGPRHLTVNADGVLLGKTNIGDPETTFERLFDVPDSLTGRKTLELEILVDPVTHMGGLDYGLLFGRFAIRP